MAVPTVHVTTYGLQGQTVIGLMVGDKDGISIGMVDVHLMACSMVGTYEDERMADSPTDMSSRVCERLVSAKMN